MYFPIIFYKYYFLYCLDWHFSHSPIKLRLFPYPVSLQETSFTLLHCDWLCCSDLSFFLSLKLLPPTPLWLAVLLLPVSLSGRSDLDRDFWNNNDSSNVQQRWSSYPPKEFLLNMSPYAPYGDPRLTPKWVSVAAGKGPLSLCRAVTKRGSQASHIEFCAPPYPQPSTTPSDWLTRTTLHSRNRQTLHTKYASKDTVHCLHRNMPP